MGNVCYSKQPEQKSSSASNSNTNGSNQTTATSNGTDTAKGTKNTFVIFIM